MRMFFNKCRGFTLIELSITIVIIGLIAGGVLVVTNLLRSAGLRAVTAEYERYAIATRTFQEEYAALPGDMPNASAYWPACVNDMPNDNTCNGNGDGRIVADSVLDLNERLRTWQHLSLAGLVEGSYTGIEDTSVTDDGYRIVPGINTPASKRLNTQISMFSFSPSTQCVIADRWNTSEAGNFRTALIWGARGAWGWSHAFKPKELFNIDRKIDDGVPGTGKVISFCADICVTNGKTESATYDLLNDSNACVAAISIK